MTDAEQQTEQPEIPIPVLDRLGMPIEVERHAIVTAVGDTTNEVCIARIMDIAPPIQGHVVVMITQPYAEVFQLGERLFVPPEQIAMIQPS